MSKYQIPGQPAQADSLTVTNNLTVDGYRIDISSGAATNQVLAYNGTSFVPANTSGAVSSVSNSDGSLIVSPTTGAVVASLNTAHANTFSAKQTFSAHIGVDGYTVDLSAGAVSNQVLQYNGTSFIAATLAPGGVTSLTGGGGVTVSASIGAITLGTSGIPEASITNLTTDLAARALTATAINTTAPLSGGGDLSATRTLSIPKATGSVDGYLSQADWTTFNGKLSTAVTSITASLPLTGGTITTSGTIAIPKSDATHDGYLYQGDWTTFNNKLSGNQTITLSGDISGSGATAITTAIGAAKVTNAMLAGLIASSKLIGTDIATVGTITAGTWNGTVVGDSFIASALTGKTYNALTLTALATGFTVAGGTTSKTLTVPLDATVSGTNTGDQTITLTGNVTGSGTGSFATTIAAGVVTNAMLAGSIANAKLLNSSIVFANGTGISGGATVSLGGTYTPAIDQTAALTWTAQENFLQSGVGTGTTVGVSVQNTTAATVGAQKYSPVLELQSQGWKTTATAGSQTVNMGLQVRPVQGTANPTGALHFLTNINAAGYTTIGNIDNSGNLTVSGTIGASNFSGTSSGTNTGDQTITLTSDVTGSGTGSFATTIAAGAVTYAKIQNISATGVLLGRKTAGAGSTEEITPAGDVTLSGSTFTIANSAVTGAKIAASTIDPTTKLTTTGTPSSSTYLRGDNTWATVSAGSGTVTSVSAGTGMSFSTITGSGAVAIDTSVVPTRKANAAETLLSTTGATDVLDYTTGAAGNYLVFVYARVITATTNFTLVVTYTDVTGAQTATVVPSAQAQAVNSYMYAPIYLNATNATHIKVTATAGTANQIYVSANIVGLQ